MTLELREVEVVPLISEGANRVLQSVQIDESRDASADGPGGTRRIQGSLDNIAAGIAHRIAETEWFLGLRIGEKSQEKILKGLEFLGKHAEYHHSNCCVERNHSRQR